MSKINKKVIYVSYNHRFEPGLVQAKKTLDTKVLGQIYYINFFYGNGTVKDIINSDWKNKGFGVLIDLGSHILDLLNFFGIKFTSKDIEIVSLKKFESLTNDYAVISIKSNTNIIIELSNLSWKNFFKLDIIGQKGSFHNFSLCKWGTAKSVLRTRVLPSGRPDEKIYKYNMTDPTWHNEWNYFNYLIRNKSYGINKKEIELSKNISQLINLEKSFYDK